MPKDTIPWPPRSPQDVLLLTPKKDKAVAPMSPSPLRSASRPPRYPLSPAMAAARRSKYTGSDLDDSDDGDEDEDEEMLRLKLQQIQAKLRLKQLQKKRKRGNSVADDGVGSQPEVQASPVKLHPPSEKAPVFNFSEEARKERLRQRETEAKMSRAAADEKMKTAAAGQVQVPASPQKQPPPSPSRVMLGIDRGLQAKDISLKRAPYLRFGEPIAGVPRPSATTSTTSRSKITSDDPFGSRPIISASTSQDRLVIKSFNQRIAEARQVENEKKAKHVNLDKNRSKGFGLTEEESAASAAAMAQASDTPISSLEAARLGADYAPPPPKPSVWTSQTKPITSSSTTMFSSGTRPSILGGSDSTGAGFDSFSQLHLSKRVTPHVTISRHLQEKTIYLLPDLLKKVVSPDFEPPDADGDWVVMGVIASKSEPRQTAKSSGSSNRDDQPAGDKYMVITLTDLKWDIELFLFQGGFTRFWKLPVGTIIAILNPGIMRPRNPDTGKFSLTLNSSEDTILEVGFARDLGHCKSTKRDGKPCGSWIDARKGIEHCSFHLEMGIKKSSNSRMELNNMGALFSPPKKGSLRPSQRFLGRGGGSRRQGGGGGGRDDGLLPEGPLPDLPQRAGGAGGKVFIHPAARSTNNLLFDEGFGDAFHAGTRENRVKAQQAKLEREREVARKLVAARAGGGSAGTGSAGGDYLRKMLDREAAGAGLSVDGAKLGENGKVVGGLRGSLVRNTADLSSLTQNRTSTAANIHLSPIKRTRNHLQFPSRASRAAQPTARPASTAASDTTEGPQKKKARVMFNRPVVTGGPGVEGDDDDDDLEIC